VHHYFKTIKKLNGKGFNLKANFLPNIVFDVDKTKVLRPLFGGFKTTNLNLHAKKKKGLLPFYWKMYGTK